jgi:hypothetical protein
LRSALSPNHANIARLGERNARIARACGIEKGPRLLSAFGTQRTTTGALAPTSGDKLGKATKHRRCDRGDSDGVSGIDHDT